MKRCSTSEREKQTEVWVAHFSSELRARLDELGGVGHEAVILSSISISSIHRLLLHLIREFRLPPDAVNRRRCGYSRFDCTGGGACEERMEGFFFCGRHGWVRGEDGLEEELFEDGK